MEKRNKIIFIAIIIVTLIIVGLCIYSLINKEEIEISDSIKFRNEYMELNAKVNDDNGKTYPDVVIDEDNTVKYVTNEKVLEILKSGTGVIYFGYNTCPWCRSLVSTLTRVAEKKNETIYYVDIKDIRTTFELKDGSIEKIKDGTPFYYDLLKSLDSVLEDYKLKDDAGNEYSTNEKRLYAPTVVAVSEGEITDIHVGTVDTQASGYDKLSSEEEQVLEKRIEELIESKDQVEVCTQNNC